MKDICKTTGHDCIKCNPGPCEHRAAEITKAEAIAHFKYGISHDIYSEPVTTYAKLALEALQERPKGRWIENRTATYNAYTDDFEEVPHYNCSLCDCPMDWKTPFCPECGHPMEVDGADMRESEQE